MLETYLDLAWSQVTDAVLTLSTEQLDELVGALFSAELDRLLDLDDAILDVAFTLALAAFFEATLRHERRRSEDE